ncbi:MAG: hypothetical protein ACLUOF_05880 [Ruminococcus sp.]
MQSPGDRLAPAKARHFSGIPLNKTHWITILLDGTLPEPELFWLLDESYTLTMPKPRKRKVHP